VNNRGSMDAITQWYAYLEKKARKGLDVFVKEWHNMPVEGLKGRDSFAEQTGLRL
jgi:hypothetical protein